MKQKYTKKQHKAIQLLLTYLDELENKPRRLYHALEELAIAFDKTGAIPSIREAQDIMYSHIDEGEAYAQLFSSLRSFKIEEWKRLAYGSNVEDVNKAICAAEWFVKHHIKNITERRF